MISGVRTYLSARVLEIDSDFREWDDGFNKENIPSTLLNKSFFIEYEISGVDNSENTFLTDTISTKITLFYKGFRDVKTALDTSMDLTDNIRINILSKAKIGLTSYLNITNSSVVASPIDESNDNSIAVEMNFDFIETKAIC